MGEKSLSRRSALAAIAAFPAALSLSTSARAEGPHLHNTGGDPAAAPPSIEDQVRALREQLEELHPGCWSIAMDIQLGVAMIARHDVRQADRFTFKAEVVA